MEIVPTLSPKPNSNWTLIIAFIIALILVLIIGQACSCDYHLRKAKAKCGFTLKTDTIYRNDTVVIREVRKDTIFNYLQKDTVIIHQGKLTIKYFYHDSLIYLQGKCAGDTIIKKVPMYITKTEIKESYLAYLKWAFFILIGVITLYILTKITIRKI